MDTVGPVFLALADPTRRAILERVRAKPMSVSAIASNFSVTRPAVSQHLRILRDAGLVRSERSGRENFYGIEFKGLMAARSYLEGFWADVVSAFQAAALAEARQKQRRS